MASKIVTIFLVFFLKSSFSQEDHLCKISTDRPVDKCPTLTPSSGLPADLTLPTEKETAESRQILGLTPVHYIWDVYYLEENQKTFTGKLKVVVKVVKPTKRILLNTFKLLFTEEISLHRCDNNETTCPTSVAVDDEKQWILLEFAQELAKDKEYTIYFHGYRGRMGEWSYDEETSAGLWRNDYKSQNWATASIFQMRGARMAYPCFDHPSLKATFDICVIHKSNVKAVSNSELLSTKTHTMGKQDGPHVTVIDCFKRTAKMSTYVTTFSLLSNFSTIVDESANPKLEIIFSSKDDPEKYRWQIAEARKILKFFKDEIGLTYDLSKLAFLNLSPVQFWGIENFGLVSIESGTPYNMHNRAEMIHRILVHEIVHQWLGNVATISHWDEICLQEGLTAFLEWTITAKLNLVNGTFEKKAADTLDEVFNTGQIEMIQEPIVAHYSFTQGIANYCFSRPPVILNMIAEAWGKDLWLKFIKQYVDKFGYHNANFNDWAQLLNSVSNTTIAGDVLRSWFYEKGEPIVYAKLLSPTVIKFQQKMYYGWGYNEEGPPIPEKGFIIPFKVQTKSGVLNEVVLVDGKNATVTLKSPIDGAFILDPNTVTFTRKVYDAENYLNIFKCYGNRNTAPCFIPEKSFRYTLRQFCRMISGPSKTSLLPWSYVTEKDDNKQSWSSVFDYLREITLNGSLRDNPCACATYVVEKNDTFSTQCKTDWNWTWSRSRVMQLLGRNYTFQAKSDRIRGRIGRPNPPR